MIDFSRIDRITWVISNGDDAPGTILETTSPEFRGVFDRADLIFAKGQGNYEGLCGMAFILSNRCANCRVCVPACPVEAIK